MALVHGALIYMLIGVFSGFLSGLFGIGGGIVVVPALLSIFQKNELIPPAHRMAFAVGTSLAIMMFVSLTSVRSHQKLGDILWGVFQQLWRGILVGVILGSIAANYFPTQWLKIIFGLFLLFISWKMIFGMGRSGPKHFPAAWINFTINVFIGVLSGLLGVGGGTLMVPYLTYCGVEPRRIAAISALCSLIISCIGTIIFMGMGLYMAYNCPFSTGAIYWPAVFWVVLPSLFFTSMGAKLTYVLPVMQLRLAFVVLLLITALDLLT